jgi:hypothetical protein
MSEFYKNLKPFDQFSEAVEDSRYQDIPDDWLIVITDIRGSTAAIEAGRYKEVNTLGATAIIGVINSLKHLTIPYVFGGDGATFSFPREYETDICKVLSMARWLAQKQFNLDLRAGVFDVGRMRLDEGLNFKVAKLKLNNEVYLAMFRGDGFHVAEERLKDPKLEKVYLDQLTPIPADPDCFAGLECRWNPLTPKNGKVVSLIVISRAAENERQKSYSTILAWIDKNLSDDSRPVSQASLPLTWPPKDLYAEVRVRTAQLGFIRQTLYWIKALGTSFLAMVLLKAKVSIGSFDPNQYLADLVKQSDHRKFENALKMILDCSQADALRLREFLTELHGKQQIYFGLHLSNKAIMTCLVFSLKDHLHLIDGSDGGYASAAKELKKQIAPCV